MNGKSSLHVLLHSTRKSFIQLYEHHADLNECRPVQVAEVSDNFSDENLKSNCTAIKSTLSPYFECEKNVPAFRIAKLGLLRPEISNLNSKMTK